MTMPGDVSQPHPASTLLPWYLTGTLKESERRAVEEHLAGCADCRVELENLTRLRIPLKTVLSEEPMPALQVKQSVMAQIHAERPSASPFEMAVRRGGIGEELEQWFRNLFAPRWIPALAATLLVGQLGLLLWTAGAIAVYKHPHRLKGLLVKRFRIGERRVLGLLRRQRKDAKPAKPGPAAQEKAG